MGIDTCLLLRVRDRAALRDALLRHSAAERRGWVEQGRGAEFDDLCRNGYDPMPLLTPLDDGAVSIFTGMRFHDAGAALNLRHWLAAHVGGDLQRIHDDARGIFAYPDVCEPRATTYEGIVAEVGAEGCFMDPAGSTPGFERAEPESAEEQAPESASAATHAGSADLASFLRNLVVNAPPITIDPSFAAAFAAGGAPEPAESPQESLRRQRDAARAWLNASSG